MMWFDKANARTVFADNRRETFVQVRTDCGNKVKAVDPDVLCDFTNLPFPDNTFAQIVFDPPHVIRDEALGNMTKFYGHLKGDWKEMLRRGFAECFRVLRPEGTLIFKWTETQIPLQTILALTPEKPLYGHRVGARARTHWISFLKEKWSELPPKRVYEPYRCCLWCGEKSDIRTVNSGEMHEQEQCMRCGARSPTRKISARVFLGSVGGGGAEPVTVNAAEQSGASSPNDRTQAQSPRTGDSTEGA